MFYSIYLYNIIPHPLYIIFTHVKENVSNVLLKSNMNTNYAIILLWYHPRVKISNTIIILNNLK